jgi:hypothetical protein
MTRLVDLEPQFITYGEREEMGEFAVGDLDTWEARGRPVEKRLHMQRFMTYVDTLAKAQGIRFLCPLCFAKNGGNIGVHGVDVTFADRGVPDHLGMHNKKGEPVRWTVSGIGYDDLTTKPSILLEGGCGWHGFITNGDAT